MVDVIEVGFAVGDDDSLRREMIWWAVEDGNGSKDWDQESHCIYIYITWVGGLVW